MEAQASVVALMGGGGGRGGGEALAGAGGVGGREPRRGARRLWRARAPRLEKEEPGPGGGLTRFPGTQGPPHPPGSGVTARPASGTCSGTAPGGGKLPGAPRALLPAPTPRRRSGAHAPPGTAPRGHPPGLPRGPEVPGAGRGCSCQWVLVRSRERRVCVTP